MSVALLRLQAMILKVSGFDLEVEYLPGEKTDPSWHKVCRTPAKHSQWTSRAPHQQKVPHSIQQYWDTRVELVVLDCVIYRGMRIVIPSSMRPAMLAVIHGTHLRIVKCKQRAREALYWPRMSAQIEGKEKDWTTCHGYAPAQQKEPLIPSPIPDLPWAMAESDIFNFESDQFLVLVDCYSKYIEVTKLKDLTSQETIQKHCGRHGIPARLITDCGVQ